MCQGCSRAAGRILQALFQLTLGHLAVDEKDPARPFAGLPVQERIAVGDCDPKRHREVSLAEPGAADQYHARRRREHVTSRKSGPARSR